MSILIAAVLVLCLPSNPPANAPPSAPPSAPATAKPVDPPLLSGPTVTTAAPTVTLVERNFDGQLVHLEDEPETAAVLRLTLTAEQRPQIDKLIANRMSALDKLVTANYTLIVDAGAALRKYAQATPDERKALLQTYASLQTAIKPWRDRGTLLDEAKAVLTAEQIAAAHTLANEYRAALAKEVAKDARSDATPMQMQIRASLDEFGRLVRQSIQRRADFANAQLADLVTQLDLTPEQAEKVKVLFMEYAVGVIQGTREKTLTARERKQLLGGLSAILTPEQRLKMGELMLDGKVKAKTPVEKHPM